MSNQDVTRILNDMAAGDREAVKKLFPLVYSEFRRLAGSYFQSENPGHTLQPTALVHECFIKMIDQTKVKWADRNHFFAVGAVAMRHLLVDHARSRGRKKRSGPKVEDFDVGRDLGLPVTEMEQLIDLDDAMVKLAALDERQSKIVEMRFFAGLSVPEVATALNVSVRTVEQDWTMARAWLKRELGRTTEVP